MTREKDMSGASEQVTDEIKQPINLDAKTSAESEEAYHEPAESKAEDPVDSKIENEPESSIPENHNSENTPLEEPDNNISLAMGGDKGDEQEEAGENKEEEIKDPSVPADNSVSQPQQDAAPEPQPIAESEQEKQAHSDNAEEEKEEEEEEDHEDEDDHKNVDYSHYSKKELVSLIAGLLKEENIKKVDAVLKEIKPHYDELRDVEREQALKRFTEGGEDAADFAYKPDELDIKFDADYILLKDRKSKHYAGLEKQKEKNLAAKNLLLEKLRNLVDDEETTASINALKEIQKEWKSIGQIPAGQVKSLWANYNALLDRFYDNRSIYFELKELDRRKNLEAKLELCEKAEKLNEENNVKLAMKELNDLHEEFRHIGPVPKEEQEPLWQRFKAASDALYDKRRVFVEKLKVNFTENLKLKQELGDEVQAFLTFDSDRINEWNEKTKQILELQKKWEAVGGLPREKARDINKHFWGGFKGFFSNKNAFFKKLEGQRVENLAKKETLVERAEALKESKDWEATAEALKKLQQEWKEIGPVPEKQRNTVFAKFKKACDHFFEQKRAKSKEVNKEFDENLKKKEEICATIEELASEKSNDLDKLEALFDQYQAIGFVPRNAIRTIQNRFNETVDKFLENAENLSEEEKHNIKLTIKFSKLKNSPNSNRKLHHKEGEIRKHISNLENDIATWRNNLEFFANSKTADKLKDDFNVKIKKAKSELKELKDQLDILRNI